jgi:alcohol dehydrogenase
MATSSSRNRVWQFSTASNIKFGRGCRSHLSAELARYGVSRPCIVTDSIVCRLPAVEALSNQLLDDGFAINTFAGGAPEPSVEVAVQAIDAARTSGADCVVGIGGGSNLDVAKIVALVLKHGGQPADYFGFDRVPGPVVPLFALPTTAGTGSEVSHSAVLTDKRQGIKVSTLSRWLRPTVALVDPDFTDRCPVTVTAHSGIDALVHAIEAYTNRSSAELIDVDPQTRAYEGSYPFTRLLASEAIRLIGRSLIPVCQPNPPETARDDMAWAATLAGMAFSNSGVGIVHALEYPLGGLTGVGHGEGNGLLLPHVMLYNLPARTDDFADIARWLGAEVSDRSPADAAASAVAHVHQLLQAIGIRTQLRQLGVLPEQISALAAKAYEIKRLMQLNPQPVTQFDLEQILQHAY